MAPGLKDFFGKLTRKFWPFAKTSEDGTFQGRDVEDIISELEGEYVKARNNQAPYRRRWRVIDNFLLGYQGGKEDFGGAVSTASDFVDKAGSDEVDINSQVYVNNKFIEVHREDMVRFTRYHPALSVAPNNPNSEKDKRGSRNSVILLNDILEKNKFETRIKIRAGRIITTKGCVFGKVTFDPTRGKEINLPDVERDESGDAIYDENGEPVLKMDENGEPVYKTGHDGEVVWDMISPANLTFPKGCIDLEHAPWLQETNIRSVAWVRERYGVEVKPENISADAGYYFSFREEDIAGDTGENCLVKERWYRPCKKFPQGAILVWANGKRLRFTTLKPFYKDIPYFMANNIHNENYIFGDTPYFHIIADQFMLNRIDSKTMRYMDVWGNVKLLVHSDADIEDEDISNEDDQILEWAGKEKPEYSRPPDLPMTLINFRNQVLENMRSKTSIRDRAQSAASGNVVAYQQDQDDSTITPALVELEQMYIDMSQFSLWLAAENYDTPRMISMTGQTKEIVEDFTGDMLEENFNVHISLMTGAPANKYARQQYYLTMFKLGALNKEQLLEFSEFPDTDKIFEEARKEISNVEDFLEHLGNGEPQPIMPWMNLELLEKKLRVYLGEKYFYFEPGVQKMAMQVYKDVEARMMEKNIQKARFMDPSDMAGPGAQEVEWMPEEMGGAKSRQTGAAQPGAEARPDAGPGSFQQV
jgi:hypothetical protein